MKTFLIVGIATTTLLAATPAPAQTLYAAPQGSGARCARAAPCALVTARDTARRVIPTMRRDLIVSLAPGIYRLSGSFVLGPADSGANGFSVIYRSQIPHAAHFSGGRAIHGWRPAGGGILQARTPTGLRFRQFYMGEIREVRARTPNGAAATDLVWNRNDMTVSLVQPLGQLPSLRGVELVATRHWQQHRLHLTSVTPGPDGRQIVTLAPDEARLSFHAPGDTIGDHQPYYLENARAFLDRPGEWFHDTDTGTLWYMPRPSEKLDHAIVPAVQTLVRLQGEPGHPVHHIAFEGVVFEYAGWNGPTDHGFIQVQATWQATPDSPAFMPAAVEIDGIGANHIRFADNIVRHFGADGLDFHKGSADNIVTGNLITDGSGQGIAIDADPGGVDGKDMGSSDIVVTNNRVDHVGIDYTGSVGIMAGYVNGARIEHNAVSDLPYSGISVGWGWTAATNPSGNNIIRANDIHHVMGEHDDGAAIYLLSRQPGTIVAENHIHDVRRAASAGDYTVAGIYLDNGAGGITVRDNAIENVTERIHVNREDHPARDNRIEDSTTANPAVVANAGPERDN